ncbi:hypothetical protein PPL_01618 [Heterostelium album PN500]|uniref:Uncharacterized protein n=1 Tax=Heterostelium pallidum (strain ATCC 26659 / Pp 5 / PN500) TaxID=670386 RepID=D3B004_HETP5|nr:hypothetical protein PPL_01618 [Heterostelium album PN500]EFA84628.1 hypothetical protein PPL_01618 [Heterostelium album PN500]|eukprot:XP_020436741.1 hypothetical protein PPL_01618 [Heterostelium album PN500]
MGLLIVPIALLVVSFTRPWYQTKLDSGEKLIYNYKTIKIEDQPYKNYTVSFSVPFDDKTDLIHSLKVFQSTFVFAIMAWCMHVIAAGFILVGLFGKLPEMLHLVPKIVVPVALGFTLISLFIFLGLPKAIDIDCSNNDNFGALCLPLGQRDKLVGSSDGSKWGPLEGWATVVASSAFSLGATVVTLVFQKF